MADRLRQEEQTGTTRANGSSVGEKEITFKMKKASHRLLTYVGTLKLEFDPLVSFQFFSIISDGMNNRSTVKILTIIHINSIQGIQNSLEIELVQRCKH